MARATEPKTLRVEFATEDAFRVEFEKNIVNGGVFVATAQTFDARDGVRIEMALRYCRKTVKLAGEVVDCIPAALAGAGGTPGVAVQLLAPTARLREQCEPFLPSKSTAASAQPSRPRSSGRASGPTSTTPSPPVPEARRPSASRDRATDAKALRKAPRSPARVPARVQTPDGQGIGGSTRDLSETGVLVTVEGTPVPVGHAVALTLEHPRTGEQLEVQGRVARHLASEDGEVTALGIEFRESGARRQALERFVADVRASEHSRRLGGIHGAISELGVEALLKMFLSSAPQGTVVLRRGAHEGRIVFADGRVRSARLGPTKGMKAFKALMRWSDGEFEFFRRQELAESDFEPVSLEAAVRKLEDLSQPGAPPPPAEEPGLEPDPALPADDTKLSVNIPLARAIRGLDTTETAVLELATVGMTLGKIVDIIPEPDDALRAALRSLIARGLIEPR